ncbi:MAG: hypothetical protein VX278_24010 [Myxococcota bacterium]|nr:hypothetical protein [Myxococcota bacterium]
MIFLLFACSGDSTDTSIPIVPATYYQDVAPILANNCVSCHRDGGSGPFALDSYENVKALGAMVSDSVVKRHMPPFHADNSGDCQKFEHSPWLSDTDLSKIYSWVELGMPEGDVVDVPIPSIEEAPFQSTHSVSFEPYEANFATASDDYRCFIVDPQVQSEGFLTGFEVLPSNREIAHHMILYAPINESALNQARAMDEADPGPGYTCYGSPGVENRMIAPWAPGSDQWHYPEGTGVKMEEGQMLILQMHYSNASEETLDSTTVNLHIQDTVANELQTDFYVYSNISIPPNTTNHVETVQRRVRQFSGFNEPIHIRAIGPHLHKLGVASSARIIREDGSESCLIDVPYYDFNWQRVYTFEEPILLQPNDKLEIECVFDSTGVSSTTYWGDGTSDEMCLMTVFASIP